MAIKTKKTFQRFTILLLLTVYLFPAVRIYTYAPYLFIGGAFVVAVLSFKGKLRVSDCFSFFTFYAFLVSFLISTVCFGYGIGETVKSSLSILVPFMAFQIGFCTVKENQAFHIWKVSFLLLLVEFAVCVIQYSQSGWGKILTFLYGSDKYANIYGAAGRIQRCIGTLGNPNICGMFCVLLAAVVLHKSNRPKINFLAIVCMTIVVLITKSRTALVCEMVLLFFKYADIANPKKTALKRVGGMLAIILALIGVYFLFSVYASRTISLASLGARFVIWENLLSVKSNLPKSMKVLCDIFGMGMPKVKSLEATDNEYLFIFLSFGWSGISIWIGSIILFALRIIKMRNWVDKQLCLTIIAIWLVSDLTMQFYSSALLSFFFFVTMGSLLASDKIPDASRRLGRRTI